MILLKKATLLTLKNNNIVYEISQIPNFNGDYSDIPIHTYNYSKTFKKIIHSLLYSKRYNLQFLDLWGVYFFRCNVFQSYFTWMTTYICYKGNSLRKWYYSFIFIFSTRIKYEEKKKNVAWKNVLYFVWRLLQCKLNKN